MTKRKPKPVEMSINMGGVASIAVIAKDMSIIEVKGFRYIDRADGSLCLCLFTDAEIKP